MKNGRFLTLGIETSCDETAAAVVADGRAVCSNIISSQIDIHRVFGGVVPEIASRHHLTNINTVIETAMKEASVSFDDIDLIGVTKGPGLVGAVLIGLSTAKALSYAMKKPFVGVHHIKAHVCSSLIQDTELKPPFLSLIVSGGHTDIIDIVSLREYKLLGQSRDDAAGEAFDKVARVLGLSYPGGPEIDRLATKGNPKSINFKRVMLEEGSLDFSFSGTKTGVLNYINTEKQAGRDINTADIAASFQASVVDVLVEKTRMALKKTGRKTLVLGGGVAANSSLRTRIKEVCSEEDISLILPSPELCTDNAAMVACAATMDYKTGIEDSLDLDAYSTIAF